MRFISSSTFSFARVIHYAFGLVAFCISGISVLAQTEPKEIGWPRQVARNGKILVYYQPQIDEWKDRKVFTAQLANHTIRITITTDLPMKHNFK